MSVIQHKSNSFHTFSTEFLENAAMFTGSDEAYACGDFFKVNLPMISLYVVNDADILKHVLIDKEPKYEKSKIYWLELRRIIGKAMGSLEGDEWTILKQLQKSFFTRSHVKSYMDDVTSLTKNGIKSLPEKQEMDLLSHLSAINLNIILKTVFGITPGDNAPIVAKMIQDGEEYISWRSKYPWRPYLSVFTPAWFRTQKALSYLSSWVSRLISEHQQDPKSMTQALIDNGYSNQHIRNEMIVHLGASTETVAVAECWTIYLLSRNPSYYKQVMSEIKENFNNDNLDLSLFPTLTAVAKESMRLYPPSHAIVRDCVDKAGDTINGHRIKKGDVMYISAYGIHRNPKYWEVPNAFKPERFMGENEAKIPTYAYLPFAAGKHACIGKYLAMPMVLTSLIYLLHQYTITFNNQEEKIPISLSTLKPHNGFFVTLTANHTT